MISLLIYLFVNRLFFGKKAIAAKFLIMIVLAIVFILAGIIFFSQINDKTLGIFSKLGNMF